MNRSRIADPLARGAGEAMGRRLQITGPLAAPGLRPSSNTALRAASSLAETLYETRPLERMNREPITVSGLHPEHWDDVARIYAEGIATGQATFETETPTWDTWDAAHLDIGRLVARKGDEIVGWAALGRISDREVYRGVAEVSVYVGDDHRGEGVGSLLLACLIEESEQEGIWTLQAGIFPENTASVRLHEKLGFREVGLRERIGRLHGRWRNVVLLERRSRVVGTGAGDGRPAIV